MKTRRLPAITLLAATLPLYCQSRAADILSTRRAIEQECRLAANGDWNRWHAALRPYRQALLQAYEHAAANPPPARSTPGEQMGFIFWRSDRGRMVHANSALAITASGDASPPTSPPIASSPSPSPSPSGSAPRASTSSSSPSPPPFRSTPKSSSPPRPSSPRTATPSPTSAGNF